MAQYEQDEFDVLAREAGPVGVHRAPRPWWTRLLLPLAVFLIAGGVAYGWVAYTWNQDIANPETSFTPTEEPTETAEPSPTATASESASPSASPTPTVSETPEPVIVYDAEVFVRNGAGIAGIAGAQQEILEADGFTAVTANNINASLIPNGENTVVYEDPELADTAAHIAELLGIDAVLEQRPPGGNQIEVLLASDPAA
ncbi:LytR C-terminal domain-containing protein [Demequina zhanjiangensis]|uniref:LytR C-terminal domain-containing protein n=1 Tax=Demequina zhanjiangensis TaxID=3051659 RepID=A0ABT8FZ18_9MICO|nr:LytR C-terminal domain-containing protein [Demequina sp. SYSU T00b26]MDN4471954.1 LytR C-terminal domain-containing protein [Demequina sp. SYSU T00b26]